MKVYYELVEACSCKLASLGAYESREEAEEAASIIESFGGVDVEIVKKVKDEE